MAYSYSNNCHDDWIKYPCQLCPPKEKGRIRGFALIQEDFVFTDITNPVEWVNGIALDQIYLVPNTEGSLGVTPVEGTGTGDTDLEIDGYDFVLQVKDRNVAGSCLAVLQVAGNKSFKAAWITETLVWLGSSTVSVAITAPVEEDIKSKMSWIYDVKWFQENPVCPDTKPGNIFDTCVDVPDVLEWTAHAIPPAPIQLTFPDLTRIQYVSNTGGVNYALNNQILDVGESYKVDYEIETFGSGSIQIVNAKFDPLFNLDQSGVLRGSTGVFSDTLTVTESGTAIAVGFSEPFGLGETYVVKNVVITKL